MMTISFIILILNYTQKEKINISKLCHGVVVGVKGHERKGGLFHVTEMITAGLPTQHPLISNISDKSISDELNSDDKYIAIISGIKEADPLEISLLFNYLEGSLVSQGENEKLLRKIVHVIFAGNNIPNIDAEPSDSMQRRVCIHSSYH